MLIKGRWGSARIAVLTITDDEFIAVQEVFNATHHILGTPYYVQTSSQSCEYGIVVRQAAERTNAPAGEAVARFVEHFFPEYVFLVGTAGGIYGRQSIALGDVVIADYVDYGEFRKLMPGRNLARKVPYDHPSLFLRETFVRPLRQRRDWVKLINRDRPPLDPKHHPSGLIPKFVWGLSKKAARLLGLSPLANDTLRGEQEPKAIEGNIISTDKIWGDPSSREQKRIVKEFDKAVAFEMESYGVAREIFNQRRSVRYNPQYLVVRGISDFVNVRGSEEQRRLWTPYAARAAAAFAFCLAQDILKSPVADYP